MKVYTGYNIGRMCTYASYNIDRSLTYTCFHVYRSRTYACCSVYMSCICWYLLVQVDYRLLVQVGYRLLAQIGTGWLQVVGTYWYRFTVVYITVKMWQWFHHLFDTYISGQLDGERIGGCSHLLDVAREHRGL
jgi:hypothetical protein